MPDPFFINSDHCAILQEKCILQAVECRTPMKDATDE